MTQDHRKTYLKVWVVLLIMIGIAVWTSSYGLSIMTVFVIVAIASIQTALVAIFFMHLRYDRKMNAAIFILSFLFLGIFAGLTASDMLDRGVVEPLRVTEATGNGTSEDIGDVAKLAKSTPDLVADGKKLYAANCASCHGADGKGDGPAAAAFTPRPRDFTAGEWKQGGKPSQIFHTLSTGIGSMPSFAALPARQRWALVHFIRTFSPNRPEDSAADLSALVEKRDKTGVQLPIRVAMNLMAVPEPLAAPEIKKTIPQPDSEGGQLYQARCAGCHGTDGQGGIRVRVLGSNPFSYLSTRSIIGSRAAWTGNFQEFIRLNSEGLPGYGKPGIADLTPAQWQALYGYVQQLAGAR